MKRKSISYRTILNGAFNFTYAGVCSVFISSHYNKYGVVCSGFTYDGINFFFAKNRYKRFEYDDLYSAILAFHKIVKDLCSSMDWYKPNYFSSDEFLKVVNENVY